MNLLSNAIKYNRPNGQVTLDCNIQSNSALRVAISETSNGIPQEIHDKKFKPFNRLGFEQSDIAGTGIGLALTKQLIESMGGETRFESTIRKRATFWVDIPIAASEARQVG